MSVKRQIRVGKNITSFALPESTWEAVDFVSDSRGLKWTEWVRGVIDGLDPSANKTEAIRTAVIDELRCNKVIEARANSQDTWEEHPIMSGGSVFDDAELSDYLDDAQSIDGENDFIGFSLTFGTDRDGRPFVAIHNSIREGVHVVIAGN